MAQSKRERYERKRDHIREKGEAGDLEPDDAEALVAWADAYDDARAIATPNESEYVGDDRWGSSRAPTTLRQWLISVSGFAETVDRSIFDATAHDLNAAAQAMKDGEADVLSAQAKRNGGLSKNSMATKQTSLIKFLQHYEDRATADPNAIHVFDRNSTLVDPSDMLTEEEFHALRTAPEYPRDVALVNLFLYTGQRNNAIRTLRVGDIDLDEGTYRLNTDVDGLKGADKVATWNPLLGAVKPLRDWMKHHPAPEDPDAFLLTARRGQAARDPSSPVSDDTVNRVLREAADRAAEEYPAIERKPTNAHAMRHNFVTMCKVRYDMDDGTIKRLIRHKPDSTVMETTYAHLSDEDYIEKAEAAFGISNGSDESEAFDPSPEFCDVCDEPLQKGAKACPGCGTVYSPDAKGALDTAKGDIREDKSEAEILELYKKLDRFEQLLEERPELADALGE